MQFLKSMGMICFLALIALWSGVAFAEQFGLVSLHTSGIDHTISTRAASCGLLRQRELERLKVVRELQTLLQRSLRGDEAALLSSNSLITNKLFMAPEDWMDETVEMRFKTELTSELQAEISAVGLENVFLIFSAPGLVWHSRAGQLPTDLKVELSEDGQSLQMTYMTYANVLCLETPEPAQVTWVPFDQQGRYVNAAE